MSVLTGIMTVNQSNEVAFMQKKIVVFAPHQDDEILGCYQVIKEQPEQVYVVFLTNGDYEGRDVAQTRWHESNRALAHLGVPQDHVIALGYADTGMKREISFLWRLWHGEPQNLIASPVSAHTYHPDGGVEYHQKKWGAHAAYTKLAVLADVRAVLEELRPDVIYLPNEDDVHGDHAATPLFVCSALEQIEGYEPVLYRYHVHGGDDEHWPNRTGDVFGKPFNMEESQWAERIRIPVDDQADYLETLKMFVSQWEDEAYMTAFIKKEQIFYHQK